MHTAGFGRLSIANCFQPDSYFKCRADARQATVPFLRPARTMRALLQQRDLILQFAKREFSLKYRGAALGLFWAVLRPLMMLAIYAVVFGFVFKSRYFQHNETPLEFGLAMFCGLALFDFFAECVGRAPTLIQNSSNLVTKVVFPLETLPVSLVVSGAVQLVIELTLLLAGCVLIRHSLPLSILFLPLILVPLLLMTLGTTWFLASFGVFVRDTSSIVRPLLTVVVYCSAIFYPIERVPPPFRTFLELNPLSLIAEQSRRVVMLGAPLEWLPWLYSFVVGLLICVFGYFFFMRTKSAFADVL